MNKPPAHHPVRWAGGGRKLREIIFRGKRVNTGEWVLGLLTYGIEENDRVIVVYGDLDHVYQYQVDLATVGQFTGLRDKNGKEIYEGDIVKGYFNTDEVENYLWLALSEMEKETGTKVFIVSDIHFGCNEPVPEELEVIGNRWDNPALLKEVSP